MRDVDKGEGKTEMIMARSRILQDKKDNLVKDLKETTLSFKKLGERYGVSRQAVHDFSKRQGIERPVKPKGHQAEGCRFCQKLIQISKKPHSEFISAHTIRKKTGVESRGKYLYHLQTLRDKGLVDEKFGRLGWWIGKRRGNELCETTYTGKEKYETSVANRG